MNILNPALVRGRLLCGLLAVVSSLCAGLPVAAQENAAPPPPAKANPAGLPTAIFVRNLAGAALAGREQAFEDLVVARVGGVGLLPFSRADVVSRLNPGPARTTPPVSFPPEAALEEQTSALRLAQNLGADYILSLTLVSLDKEVRHFTGSGVSTVNTVYTLRCAWRLLEAGQGGAITGDTVAATRIFREAGSLTESASDVTGGLLADAAAKVAEAVRLRLAEDAARVAAARPKESDRVSFTVRVSAENIFFPELVIGEDKTLRIANPKGAVGVDSVVVELDGVALGSATDGQTFRARPGLHRLRLSRDGFKPWEGMVNLFDGFAFNAALELSDAGLARWREQSRFIQDLKNDTRLTDARIEAILGYAESLRQSGFKIDYKVDAKEFPADNSVRVIH